MLKAIHLPLFFLVFGVFAARSQPGQYQFSQLSISNGLSHNLVTCILKDHRGFMWFGTMSGLNRYDGYSFKIFRHSRRDTASLNDDYVMNIQEGPDKKLWIQTRAGYVIYDPAKESFSRHPERFLGQKGIAGKLTDIRGDGDGHFWLITDKGVYRYNETEKKVLLLSLTRGGPLPASLSVAANGNVWVAYRNGGIDVFSKKENKAVWKGKVAPAAENALYKIFTDAGNDAWIYSTDRPQGVFFISHDWRTREQYTRTSRLLRLNTNNIYSISQDKRGILWVGTDHGGINLIDKKSKNVRFLLNSESDEKSLAQNSTPVIYTDNNGTVWVGTFKRGISYYHEGIIKFPLYSHRPGDTHSLPYDDVNRFAEDEKGNLWIGTNGGGLIYFDRQNNTFRQLKHLQDNSNSVGNDVIVSLWVDREKKLWIGSYFGGLDCYDGKRFTHFRNKKADPQSLSDDRVWEVMEDSDRNLWVGTLAGGVNVFDSKRLLVRHFTSGAGNTVKSNYIAALEEDAKGNIWIGTDNGIDVLIKKTGRFIHYSHSEGDPGSLSNNNVLSLLKDSRGWIWVGTQEGLNIYDPVKNTFRTLTSSDGLADNTILTLLEDDEHHIWASTPNGLSNIIVSKKSGAYTYRFTNYDEMDGLQGRQFNENAAFKTQKGELIFGGANGFNIFHPGRISTNRQPPEVVLTGFQLFNRDMRPPELSKGKRIAGNSITESKQIVLDYDQNVFSIEFAALNYSNPSKNKYSYILEGFNDKWLTTDSKNRKATFTNLDPGDYVFRVRASNDSGVWNNGGVALKIKILPPFWKTPLAYVFYAATVLLILLYVRRRGIRKLKEQFAIEQERQDAQRMHELDMMKIKFFTNVSHEFRTPLSLILSPLDNLLKNTGNTTDKNHLLMVQRNANRLLNLVNQLMDFRKMEVNELKLQSEEGDIVAFIKESFQSFTDLAEKKSIRFSFISGPGTYHTEFDHDKVERILFNLISNAFKFTPDGGWISLELILKSNSNEHDVLQILVKDSGIGIPAEKHEKIFERFFQHDVPGSIVNQGSGIGLAITKEFVSLHGGTIEVTSEPDKGSCFTVTIPFKRNEKAVVVPRTDTSVSRPQTGEQGRPGAFENEKTLPEARQKKRKVLLIEDNEDFRFYLKENLKQHYQISEASDGREGWSKALAEQPDLIVSDISMPQMNGIDLCQKIRNDKRTQHIPVILLTAMTGEELLLRSLGIGANDYMTKPFNFEVLASKIRNLCVQQESMRKTYQRQIEASPAEVTVVPADEKFIRQALEIIEKNISNSGFSVEEFSRDMAMSRVALYKKLLHLTRQTPIEFIRTMRLKRALQLLEKSQLTVAEIAYETGFNNPKSFARYFKAEFGVLPSAWSKNHRPEPPAENRVLQ